MKKIALILSLAAFAAAVGSAGMVTSSFAADKPAAKTAKAKAMPGMCGTNMYYNKKTKKCADATAKGKGGE